MANFLLAKFGKKEHLKQMQEGKIFFNSIQKYRDDGTDFRGDYMEGKIPLNPNEIEIYSSSGERFFENFPRPEMVIESVLNDENLMMLCGSIITKNVLIETAPNIWQFTDDFKSEMIKFGEYVIIFYSIELLGKIKEYTDINGQHIGYDSRPIKYRELDDYYNVENYKVSGDVLDRYFVKRLSYKKQNEWRVIIDGEHEHLFPNYMGGYLLESTPFKYSVIKNTEEFLNGYLRFN